MDFKRYPFYKNSGVEWLGEIPEHWVGSKFKYIFQEKQHTKNMNLPFGAISFGSVVYKEDKANLTDELKENYQEVLQGEFLVNPLNLNYDLKSLRTALSKIDVVVSSGYFVLKLKNNTFNKRYLEYLLYIFDIRKMKTLGAGIRQTLTFKDMAVCDVAIPSACEQTQIASFLDSETSRIDNLIAKQEKLIEKLEEHRKSVISHAVTKGLDPNAKMKDSGVEWLGEVPEHWEVRPLKYLGNCKNGINIGAEYFGSGSPFISYGDVYRNSELPTIFNGLVQSTENDKRIYSVQRGDVLFTRTSETIEEIGFSSTCLADVKDATFAGFLIRFRPIKKSLLPEYSKYYFRNILLRSFFVKEMNLVTRASLSQELLKKLAVPLPSQEEQSEIVSFLDSKTYRIDNLIEKQRKLIEKLKSYRTSIISHAVTGKIDVRDLVA